MIYNIYKNDILTYTVEITDYVVRVREIAVYIEQYEDIELEEKGEIEEKIEENPILYEFYNCSYFCAENEENFSILICTDDTNYVLVSQNCLHFNTEFPVTKFYSRTTIYHSRYDYAMSSTHLYLFHVNMMLNISELDPELLEKFKSNTECPYDYYHHNNDQESQSFDNCPKGIIL